MRLWIVSDLHLTKSELGAGDQSLAPPAEADVAIVAGDVTDGVVEAMEFLARTIARQMPVVTVLGNHEFFGEDYRRTRREAAKIAEHVSGLILLDDTETIIGGVRFVGGSLWTDYSIYSGDDEKRVRMAMIVARQLLSDHTQIEVGAADPGVMSRDWAPSDALKAHRATVAFLDRALSRKYSGPTVVVTHHAPHPRCVAQRFDGHALTPAFVSDLSAMIGHAKPKLWVHGHVHDRFDIDVGETRIVCNPRGYRGERSDFDPRFVIEI